MLGVGRGLPAFPVGSNLAVIKTNMDTLAITIVSKLVVIVVIAITVVVGSYPGHTATQRTVAWKW